ncbi:partner and localizer of BRCA2 [Mastacembelus armatus]|uniref:Partner and localizer of BRCA2 n=1 Tax=Mastacembelus armatus TaxID=205130 RepID=A0A3Q3LBP3_9TELE|nr:partner and localizer of BRCA2 [Mastacembelus armatus]XP_026158452.1 partner and localizer of BRCA2 [Mastacembelus armatus]XP_026158453.1 partner and localizer of BRCA2 [Mastacembelus armatus]
MEHSVGDILPCEEKLRTTLYGDDTEKLRRKLALLQKEYIRTAHRLQRAERLDAVRRHVRSRITQQNQQDQSNPEVTSNPCLNPKTLDSTDTTSQCQKLTEGSADSDHSKRSQVIRFQLPSDSSNDITRGHRSSPAMRLRSRQSRQRWERRSVEACKITDDKDKGQEQNERMETAREEGQEEKVKLTEADVDESDEPLSASESESPSLLLPHWNRDTNNKTGDMEGTEMQRYQQQREKETELRTEWKQELESSSFPFKYWKDSLQTEERRLDGSLNGQRKEMQGAEDVKCIREQREIKVCEENSNKDAEQNAAEKIENKTKHNTMEIKENRAGIEGAEKRVGVLDSCTLVEGLLFPAEYYVRTTRRMTISQTQPDMQAIILSQLSTGRQRRRRGRGRGLNRNTHTSEHSNQHVPSADSPSQTDAPVDPHKSSYVQAPDASPELASNNQSSNEISDQTSASPLLTTREAFTSAAACATRPRRGRRRGRGRGRGTSQTPRSSLNTNHLGHGQTSNNTRTSGTPVSCSPSVHVADGPQPCLTLQEDAPVPDGPPPASIHSTAMLHSSGEQGAQSCPASGSLQKVYPIFVKSSISTSSQMNTSGANWQSLLLPSPPPTQTPIHPLPFQSLGLLVSSIRNFDVNQDFHLPDDQFASLKLHKLRKVAVESGVEYFTSPSNNTRSSYRRSDTFCASSNEPVIPCSLPLSLTPTISDPLNFTDHKQTTTQCEELHNLSTDHRLASQALPEGLSKQDTRETCGEQQTENLHTETHICSTDSVSVTEDCDANVINQYKEHETVTLNSHNQNSISASNTHRSLHQPVKPYLNHVDRAAGNVMDQVIGHLDELKIQQLASEKQTDCAGVVHPLKDQLPETHLTEHKAIVSPLSFDCPLQETLDKPSNKCTATVAFNDIESPEDSNGKHLTVKSPARDSKEPCKLTARSPKDRSVENKDEEKSIVPQSAYSELILSSPLASAPCPLITPPVPSSALLSSPTLPSLGFTPRSTLPPTSSPAAPCLTLPPSHSPSTQALSPPPLSPFPSLACPPASQPPVSPSSQNPSSLQPSNAHDQCQKVETATCPTVSSIHPQGSGGEVGVRTEETKKHVLRCTYTLKAPAGGCVVDACCLTGHAGDLCVAAAGKWAVCLWSQISANNWSLTHTWTFNKPVINVFPVPDAAGLICVTLGQLEIREVRILSCSSLVQVLLCDGSIQAVVGVSNSRVITSSDSAAGSTLQVFDMSDNNSTLSSQPLVSPGVCVGALASVDGLPDALIGTDECKHLFIWNVKTGQLLRTVTLGDDLSHTACLRGYSCCGVLFVLLQHQLLSSLEEEENEAKVKDQIFSEEGKEEEKKTAFFSLVAVNPVSGKSVLATRLYPPKAWSGRLCEADVSSCTVVGLSQSGCVCVWELRNRGASGMVWAPESEGWQLARWGGQDMLLTGHHNGNITLHCYRSCQT